MSVLRSASIAVRLQIRAQIGSAPHLLRAPHLRAASLAFGRPQLASSVRQTLTIRTFAMDVTTTSGKSRTALHETGDGGAFVRKDSVYRGWIEEGGEFPPEGETCGYGHVGTSDDVACLHCEQHACGMHGLDLSYYAAHAAGRYTLYICYACPVSVRMRKVSTACC